MTVTPTCLLEEASARAVLAAYFPWGLDIREDQRMPRALKARAQQFPDEKPEDSKLAVEALLSRHKNEQALLLCYSQLIMKNIHEIHAFVERIRSISKNGNDARRNHLEIWTLITSALERSASISRKFEASPMGKPTAAEMQQREFRKKLLSLTFFQLDKYGATAREARNICEHFEEYLDGMLHEAIDKGTKLLDLRCSNPAEAQADEVIGPVLRWFDYQNETIHVLNRSIELADLDGAWLFGELVVHERVHLCGRYGVQYPIALKIGA